MLTPSLRRTFKQAARDPAVKRRGVEYATRGSLALNLSREVTMARSLFLFDMTFWLYLAALVLYIAYLFAKRPVMALAPAGHPSEVSTNATAPGPRSWAGRHVGHGVWVGRQFARLIHARLRADAVSGTFAPWSNQFEAMAYVSWAIILGMCSWNCATRSRPSAHLWSASDSLPWARPRCCPIGIRRRNRSCPRSTATGSISMCRSR